jgi:NAD(P)-dependent dehydrogenase (short-subunit alcohol dehydrogenase family)
MPEVTDSHKPVAIISGGLGDIGSAVARELSRRFGARIALGDVRPDAVAEPLLAEIRADGGQAMYTRIDVANAAAVLDWVEAAEVRFDAPPSLVVPNAATVTLRGVRDVSPDEWARELAVNLSGGFHLAQATAKRLLALARPGRIVFVGSWAADAVHSDLPTYCVTKAGLRMLMCCLALDLAPDDILVNEVAPGYVDAGLSRSIFDAQPGRREAATARVPNGRLITPEEVAREVAHLCEPKTRHCVGTTILMDGGLSLRTPGDRRDE